MSHVTIRSALLSGLLATSLMLPALAQEGAQTDIGTLDKARAEQAFKKPSYSPYAGRNFPTRPFFGDTHLYTSFSMDAGAFGARLSPRDAYRFAQGEEVTASSGQPAKLSRPLDFLVVADHSDNMGFFPDLFAGKPEMLADPTGRRWYDMIQSGKGAEAAIEIIVAFSHGTFPKALMYFPGTRGYRGAWQETIKAAEDFNDPEHFTAFIGFEWTSNTGGNNLHRKDPIGANLDRIQIIKGWLDAKGEVQEKVYDVVWSDDRKLGTDGTLPPVGNTVDVENAIWTNTIGDPELIAVWKDPDFDATQRAFYYARVLEIPTPRWTAYDAKRFGVKPLPGTTMTLQERAYTSPIWYTPGKEQQ